MKLANLIGIPVVGLHQGQRSYVPRHQAGHMTAADQTVQREKSACHEAVHICLTGVDARQCRISDRVRSLNPQSSTHGRELPTFSYLTHLDWDEKHHGLTTGAPVQIDLRHYSLMSEPILVSLVRTFRALPLGKMTSTREAHFFGVGAV